MRMKCVLVLSGLLIFVTQLAAQLKMPAFFSDHMVLQCGQKVAIWGTAAPGVKITVKPSWNHTTQSAVVSKDGKWKIFIQTPEAGGPYSMVVSDGHPTEIKDILLGEVWLCSGQSNMSRPMKPTGKDTIKGAKEEFKNAHQYNIRYFEVAKGGQWALQDDVGGSWKQVSSQTLPDLSATSWFFGKTLQEHIKSPVGLIVSSWGGSKIEAWMSARTLHEFPRIQLPSVADTIKEARKTPTILYNNMLYPLIGYGIRGMIWYQGESNMANPALYEKLLPAMVADWRNSWKAGNFPFYFLQLAPYNYNNGHHSAYFREAQLRIAGMIPNAGIGFLTDAGEEKNIHPSNKKAAGERLAYLALARTYGLKNITPTGPVYKSMQVKSSKVYLSFYNANKGLSSDDKELSNFEIAGEDRRFYPALAKIVNNAVVVFNEEKVPKPIAVRYAFKDFVVGDLFNKEGLPASSFRTDNW